MISDQEHFQNINREFKKIGLSVKFIHICLELQEMQISILNTFGFSLLDLCSALRKLEYFLSDIDVETDKKSYLINCSKKCYLVGGYLN